jgi:lysophospholipase L1-like esterase
MRICFVGDSMVNGTGDPAYLGWVGRVLRAEHKQRAELTGYNLGIRRDRSDQIRARWRAEVEARLPAAFEGRVVFSFGANDAVQDVAPATTLGHAEAILAEAKARWPVLMVGVVPMDAEPARGRCQVLDRGLASLCKRLDVPFVSVFDGLVASSVWFDEVRAGDGAHPASGGYGRMAELVLESPAWQRWIRSAA